MNTIKASTKFSFYAICIITLLFLAIISPLKGLSILTFPLILLSLGLWIASLILLIKILINKKNKNHENIILIRSFLLIIAFIPISLIYINISGSVRTNIKVSIKNHSDFNLSSILIYGTGNIFEGNDTLKIINFYKNKEIEYLVSPVTKAHKKGAIMMEFDIEGKHIIKQIAGEFSINPYNIKQHWDIVVNDKFLNNK